MKKLVPASATLAIVLDALVKYMKDLGGEHEDWLESRGRANFSFAELSKTKAIYDLIQGAHAKALTPTIFAVL